MEIIAPIALVLCGLALCFCAWALVRNNQVGDLRMKMIDWAYSDTHLYVQRASWLRDDDGYGGMLRRALFHPLHSTIPPRHREEFLRWLATMEG